MGGSQITLAPIGLPKYFTRQHSHRNQPRLQSVKPENYREHKVLRESAPEADAWDVWVWGRDDDDDDKGCVCCGGSCEPKRRSRFELIMKDCFVISNIHQSCGQVSQRRGIRMGVL